MFVGHGHGDTPNSRGVHASKDRNIPNLLENVVAGPRWAKYYIGPLQFIICFGTVIGGPLVGGKSLKVIILKGSLHFLF